MIRLIALSSMKMYVFASCIFALLMIGRLNVFGQSIEEYVGEVVFVHDDQSGNGSDLYILNLANGHVKRLTNVLRDYYIRFVGEAACNDLTKPIIIFELQGTLFSVNAFSQQASPVVFGEENYESPSVAPAGSAIAYVINGNAGHSMQIAISALTGNTANVIYSSQAMLKYTTWSPDGAFVATTAYADEEYVLLIVSRDGREIKEIYRSVAPIFSPSWSPNGEYISFASNPSGSFDIYRIAIDALEVTALTADAGNNLAPVWAPDGLHIIFSSDRDNTGYQIYAMRPDGSEVNRLTADLFDDTDNLPQCMFSSFAVQSTISISPGFHDPILVATQSSANSPELPPMITDSPARQDISPAPLLPPSTFPPVVTSSSISAQAEQNVNVVLLIVLFVAVFALLKIYCVRRRC